MSGVGSFALMGASGFLTCIYALTKINYTYQIPILIGITLRGRPGDGAKFHQSNGLYLEPVIAAIDMPFIPIERNEDISEIVTAYKHSRVMSRPVVVGFTREVLRGDADDAHRRLLQAADRAPQGRGGRHLGRQLLGAVVGDHRRDRARVLSRSLDEPRLAVRRRHRARLAGARWWWRSPATARS